MKSQPKPTTDSSTWKVVTVSGALLALGVSLVGYRLFGGGTGGPTDTTKPRDTSVKRNEAFLFIKPHGQLASIKKLVVRELTEVHGLTILDSGDINGATIAQEGLIDAHYAAVGNYAMKVPPHQLALSDEAKANFRRLYGGLDWDQACHEGRVVNLATAIHQLSPNLEDEAKVSTKIAKAYEHAKKEKGMKLMPGCYTAELPQGDEFKGLIVVNGFYGPMQSEYVDPAAVVTWYRVAWDPAATGISWSEFRSEILGATDPSVASPSSIRAKILAQYKELGLEFAPNTGINCVHGSASPLEAFNERWIWLGPKAFPSIESDEFGAQLKQRLPASVASDMATVRELLGNPTIAVPIVGTKEFKKKRVPLFDYVEDTDTEECIQRLVSVFGLDAES